MIIDFPKPQSGGDFEQLVAALLGSQFGSRLDRYARNGQSQYGVDILARDHLGDLHGFQCKLGSVGIRTIRRQLDLARSFTPPLATYTLVTAMKRHGPLQSQVAALDTHPFGVDIWFWDTLNDRLNRTPHIAFAYFAGLMGSRQGDSVEEHSRALRTALSRPAFFDPIEHERSQDNLQEALAATITFLNTGFLYSRTQDLVVGTLPAFRYEDEKYQSFLEAFEEDLRALYRYVQANSEALDARGTPEFRAAASQFTKRRSRLLASARPWTGELEWDW